MSNVPPPSDPPGNPPPPPPVAGGAAAPMPAADTGGVLSATWLMNGAPAPAGWAPKQKVIAGVLGILIGGLGIHSFYMGNSKKGLIQIAATVVTCGFASIWGLIEGIMILIGNVKTDAYGVPLAE